MADYIPSTLPTSCPFLACAPRSPNHGSGETADIIRTAPPIQTAVFGLLYVVQQERPGGPSWLTAGFFLMIDALQLLMLFIQPQLGWLINEEEWCDTGWAGVKRLQAMQLHKPDAG